jgi:hypothetical protein
MRQQRERPIDTLSIRASDTTYRPDMAQKVQDRGKAAEDKTDEGKDKGTGQQADAESNSRAHDRIAIAATDRGRQRQNRVLAIRDVATEPPSRQRVEFKAPMTSATRRRIKRGLRTSTKQNAAVVPENGARNRIQNGRASRCINGYPSE